LVLSSILILSDLLENERREAWGAMETHNDQFLTRKHPVETVEVEIYAFGETRSCTRVWHFGEFERAVEEQNM
jgi:hypothetical protein